MNNGFECSFVKKLHEKSVKSWFISTIQFENYFLNIPNHILNTHIVYQRPTHKLSFYFEETMFWKNSIWKISLNGAVFHQMPNHNYLTP